MLNFSNYVLRQRWQLKLQKVMFGSFSKADVDSTSRTSTENVTSRRGFFNHFSIIRSHYSCQMCSNYTGIKLEAALQSRLRRQNWTSVIICSRRPHNCKTGDFTSWKDRERLPNVQKWKMHVQSVQNCCFSLQICRLMTLLLPSLSWLLKLPNLIGWTRKDKRAARAACT